MTKNLFFILICFYSLFACNNRSTDKEVLNSTDTVISTISASLTPKIKKVEKWDSINSSDEETDYTKYIQNDRINKKQKNKTKYGKEEIVYLGEIKDNNGNPISHVLSIYGEVKAAIEVHGHSEIIFINNNLKQKKEYYLNDPEELPFKLENNNLYFHYKDEETAKESIYIDTIGTKLPWLICFGPNTCN